MDPPEAVFAERHLTLVLRGLAAAAALCRQIDVPYAAVARASVDPPEWPGWLQVRIGTNWPGVAAMGTFWTPGRTRFLWLRAGTRATLTLELRGLPWDEVRVEVAEPERAYQELQRRLGERAQNAS